MVYNKNEIQTYSNTETGNQERRRRKGILIPQNTDLHDCFVQFAEQIQSQIQQQNQTHT